MQGPMKPIYWIIVLGVIGLRRFADKEGVMPLLVDSLNNPETLVRETAHDNLLNYYGGALPGGLKYDVDDPPQKRIRVINRLRELSNTVHVTPDMLDKKK